MAQAFPFRPQESFRGIWVWTRGAVGAGILLAEEMGVWGWLKLDRSFLLNQEDRERQVKIMKRIVDLADDLNAQIVCEGVETNSDVELMREIGANDVRGNAAPP